MRTKLLSLFLLAGLFISSCGGGDSPVDELVAKGGKKYGGDFTFMSVEKATSLFPTYAADHYSSRMIGQIYEPLMSYDMKSMTVVPAVAESFTVSNDAKVYTFKIRKGLTFHEDACFEKGGQELTAEDVKFTFDLACSGLAKNQISYLLTNRIDGGDAFSKASSNSLPEKGVSGIKVVDDHTIEIHLKEPIIGFESILSHLNLGIVSKKAFEKYGDDIDNHPIGTGPFKLVSASDEKIELARNENYWKKDEFGNQLPFLNKVVMTYAKDKKSELMAFRNSEIDLVLEIPVEEIQNILGTLKEAQDGKNVKHKIDSHKSLSMTYIATACQSEEFSDARVRQALNMAIKREDIVDNWLEGEGWPALAGIVPDIPGYDNEAVKGASYNPEQARSLLASAGYPNGKNFPTLDFYVNGKEGTGVHKMAQSVATQLKKNLNINLNIKLCTIEEREEAIANGTAKIWRAGWVADYPDAQNFLNLFYGGNLQGHSTMINSFKFQNPQFDEVFEQASSESDQAKRSELLAKCDQIVVDQAAVLPILTDDHIVMVNARVRNFEANPMETLYLTDVFIKEIRKN